MAAASALLGACGGDSEREASRSANALTVEQLPRGSGGPRDVDVVDCDQRPDACAVPFAPVPRDQACTQEFGGAALARVEGVVDGREVRTTFRLTDGCEIARWERAAALIGKPPNR